MISANVICYDSLYISPSCITNAYLPNAEVFLIYCWTALNHIFIYVASDAKKQTNKKIMEFGSELDSLGRSFERKLSCVWKHLQSTFLSSVSERHRWSWLRPLDMKYSYFNQSYSTRRKNLFRSLAINTQLITWLISTLLWTQSLLSNLLSQNPSHFFLSLAGSHCGDICFL